MKKTATLALVAVIATLSSFTSPLGKEMQETVIINDGFSIPFTTTWINPCTNGSPVTFTATYHYVVRGVIKSDNSVSLIYHRDFSNIIGADEDGRVYRGGGAHTLSLTGNMEEGKFTVTIPASFVLTTEGSHNNILLKQRQHLTVNAKGEVTIELESVENTCQ